jgi:hypothetical protein
VRVLRGHPNDPELTPRSRSSTPSGTPGGKDETVSIALFTKSWATSDDRMIVTEETG